MVKNLKEKNKSSFTRGLAYFVIISTILASVFVLGILVLISLGILPSTN